MGDHGFCHMLLRATRGLPPGPDSMLGSAGGLATWGLYWYLLLCSKPPQI